MTMLLGDSIALSASGMRADGTPANLSEYTLSYQSSDASIVAVDGSGKLTAHALGQAVITLTATKGEEQARASIDVTVSETAEGFHLKFSAVDTNKDSGKFEIAAYNDAGFTVDPDKSNNSSHRIFAVGTAGSMRSLHVEMGPSTANWMGSNAENMKYRFTVRFKVPYSANYDISFQGCVWYAGCLADIFVDDTYLGDYNFYDGDESFTSVREYGENKQLNSVYLTAGTHEVSFRTRGSGKFSTEYLILHEMTFTPTEKPLTLSHIEATIPGKTHHGRGDTNAP